MLKKTILILMSGILTSCVVPADNCYYPSTRGYVNFQYHTPYWSNPYCSRPAPWGNRASIHYGYNRNFYVCP